MIQGMWALTKRELKHWSRSKIEIVLLIVLPLTMLALFGQAFNEIGNYLSPDQLSGAPDYVSFMSVGLLSMTTLMTCMFCGMSIVMDHKSGFLNKMKVAPISRSTIPISRMLSTVLKSMLQAFIMFCIALLFTLVPGLTGLTLKSGFSIIDLLGIFFVLFLLAWILSSFVITMALAIKNPEAMLGMINLLNMPLMFVSAILFPTILMPDWLKVLANINPLTLASDAMRQFAFAGTAPIYDLWMDISILAIVAVLMFVACSIVSRRLLSNR